ncbi:MAG TPA: glutamine amidotransferase [Planctomycetaceae bacterium]|nr:glutamine amidotransferase [Planctomycetaceae bacterium]
MMPGPILYCGDTDLTSAAGYLAGLMTSWGMPFEYVRSNEAIEEPRLSQAYSLIILSDYPAAMMPLSTQESLIDQVEAGAGLLMIGGWESFQGSGGDWDQTLVADALPVIIGAEDDRLNFDQGAYLREAVATAVTAGLPWRERPPLIGGMNRLRAKPDTQTVMEALPLGTRFDAAGQLEMTTLNPIPALVLGQCEKGKTAAFGSDVAPHWVGGFVDWGNERVTAQANSAGSIEVGNWYAQFWRQLLESLAA